MNYDDPNWPTDPYTGGKLTPEQIREIASVLEEYAQNEEMINQFYTDFGYKLNIAAYALRYAYWININKL